MVLDAEMNTRAFTEKTAPDFVTRNDNNFYDTRNYKGKPKAYIELPPKVRFLLSNFGG